jgi:hypothetical protein
MLKKGNLELENSYYLIGGQELSIYFYLSG